MKKIILSVLLIFSLTNLQAQDAVLTTGGEASGSGGSASYSVGQVFYTSKGTNGTITDGVQQPYEYYIGVDKIEGVSLSMAVFPNPTSATISLEVKDLSTDAISFELHDATGKFILSRNVQDIMTLIPMQELASGTYFLTVRHQKAIVKTFSIIKNKQ